MSATQARVPIASGSVRPMPGPASRGRPLDRARDQPILDAALALLGERGIDRFRMQDVATRAGVGLATIYRRWPSKNDLVLASLKSIVLEADDRDKTSLNGLRRQLDGLASALATEQVDLVPSLIGALHRDPELAEAFRATWLQPRLDGLAAAIDASAARPVDPRTRELIAEMGLGLLMFRALIAHQPVDRPTVQRIVNALIRPLLAGDTRS